MSNYLAVLAATKEKLNNYVPCLGDLFEKRSLECYNTPNRLKVGVKTRAHPTRGHETEVSVCLAWAGTPEGHNFWSSIAEVFLEHNYIELPLSTAEERVASLCEAADLLPLLASLDEKETAETFLL